MGVHYFRSIFLPVLVFASLQKTTAQIRFTGTNDYSFQNLYALNPVTGNNVLYSFPILDPTNAFNLIEGPGGKLFGLTGFGGTDQSGTIFSINADGSNRQVIYNFPVGGGYLRAGAGNRLFFKLHDSLYSLMADGSGKQLITAIPGTTGAFTIDSSGWIYGNRLNQGNYEIFKIRTDGSGFALLHTFSSDIEGYYNLNQAPAVSPTGKIYGLCNGGQANRGIFFSMRTDGSAFTIENTFNSGEGYNPVTRNAVAIANGKVFFSLDGGGAYYYGRLVAFDTSSSTMTTLLEYNAISPLQNPIVVGNALIAITTAGMVSVNQDGSNFRRLTGAFRPFQEPALIYHSLTNNIFYIDKGGTYNNTAIFKTSIPDSGVTVVHSFGNVPAGHSPLTPLKARDGKLYGFTYGGGATGGGVMYRIKQDGSEFRLLHDFATNDGMVLQGFTLQASDGKFYGFRSTNGIYGTDASTILFSIDSTGNQYRVLKTFSIWEGALSVFLSFEHNGQLYGTTQYPATIFKINKDGSNYSIIKQFSSSEGEELLPFLALHNGYIYGVCGTGGNLRGGTVFKISEAGTNFTLLHQFDYDDQGLSASSTVIKASNNVLYGTTDFGGAYGAGTIYSIALSDDHTITTLYDFDAELDGYQKGLGFMQASDGRLYSNREKLFSIDTLGVAPVRLSDVNTFYYMQEIAPTSNCEDGRIQFYSGINGPGYTYLWQIDTGNGFTNLNIDSVHSQTNTQTLQLNNVPGHFDGYKYRCAVNTGTMTVYSSESTLNLYNNWTGNIDSSWENPLNWACGRVPGKFSNVIVPTLSTNSPVINNNSSCSRLYVQKGANFIIATGAQLEITGK